MTAKILKNQLLAPLPIGDTGVTLPASPTTYTIPEEDWLIWAASSDIVTEVGNGNVIVSDSGNDLSISDGIGLIKFACCDESAQGSQKRFPGEIIGTTVGSDNTLIDQTCPANTAWKLDICYLSCTQDGCVRILKDSELIGFGYVGPGDHNFSFKWENPEPIAASERLRVIFDQSTDTKSTTVRSQIQYREFT